MRAGKTNRLCTAVMSAILALTPQSAYAYATSLAPQSSALRQGDSSSRHPAGHSPSWTDQMEADNVIDSSPSGDEEQSTEHSMGPLQSMPLYFSGPWEQEPNNNDLEANGSVISGQEYYGYPNDQRDYFSFYMRESGDIDVQLTNHTGDAVQLQLFYQSDNDLKIYDVEDPYDLEYAGSPGWYYVYIFAGGGYNDITPYTLRVTYPGELAPYALVLHGLYKDSSGVSSRYVITNEGSVEASTWHEFLDENGEPVDAFSSNIPADAALTYDLATMGELPSGYAGYAIVSADQPITGTLLDVMPPSSVAASPDYATSGPIPVVWSASDDDSGVALTTLWATYGSEGAWGSTGLTQSGTAGTLNYTPTSGEGQYYFATVATDFAGNSEETPSSDGDTSTVYDATRPSSQVQVSELERTSTVSLPWTAGDAVSGVSSTALWAKVGPLGTWSATGLTQLGTEGTFHYTFGEGEVTYYFATVATDYAGNLEALPSGSGDGACAYQLYRVYLPLGLRNYVRMFAGPMELEPNDSYPEANGSIYSGQDYYGYPNDEKDYFSFYMREGGDIDVKLTNHTGDAVQLQLFYQSTSNRVAYDTSAPYHIQTSGTPGWYFVYIYTGGGYTQATPYTLRATYPH